MFTDFVPMLRARGLRDDEISSILEENPRRFFAGEALPPAGANWISNATTVG
jgi:phosphotriesterase-related protein